MPSQATPGSSGGQSRLYHLWLRWGSIGGVLPVEQEAPEGNPHKLYGSKQSSGSLVLLTPTESDITLGLRAANHANHGFVYMVVKWNTPAHPYKNYNGR